MLISIVFRIGQKDAVAAVEYQPSLSLKTHQAGLWSGWQTWQACHATRCKLFNDHQDQEDTRICYGRRFLSELPSSEVGVVAADPDRVGRCCTLDLEPTSLMPDPILRGGLSS